MTPLLVIAVAVAAFVVIFALKGLVIVQQAQTVVVERLGRFHALLPSGINVIWPIIDQPRAIVWREYAMDDRGRQVSRSTLVTRIDLREQVFDFAKQSVITRDNVNIEIDAMVYFQVTDPRRAVYEIADLPNAIEKLTQTTLRNVIGELDLDESLTSRDTINAKLRAILDEATDKWGVKANRVELKDIMPPRDIQDAMEKQMRAERDRRAAILTAEGDKRARILEAEGVRESEVQRAEGEKQAAILRAEGEAQARVAVAEAEAEAVKRVAAAAAHASPEAIRYLTALRYIDAVEGMVAGDETRTVYIPYEMSGLLSALGAIKDLGVGQK